MIALGLHSCMGGGYSLVVMCGLLIDVAFVIAEPQALGCAGQ